MNKRLILALTIVFVAVFAFAAYAEVQNVKVSGDMAAYGLNRNFSLKGAKNNTVENALATIARLKVDADLTDNVLATVRLLNERYWGNETDNVSTTGSDNTEIVLDLAYVTLKEFLYSPLTVVVGRQELHFGNDMIVGDPDTNNNATVKSPFGVNHRDKDLSARKAFDAIRLTLNYDPLIIDAIASLISKSDLRADTDTNLYGVNIGYDTSFWKSKVEGYWFERRRGRDVATAGIDKVDRVDVLGIRIVTNPLENLIYQLEGAYQFGKYVPVTLATDQPVVDRKAWALETALTYNMPKVKFTPSVTALYSYFRGDNNNHYGNYNTSGGTYRGWDPMFENQKTGDIANALFNQTNVHIVGGLLTGKPVDDVTLKGEYYAYWWDKAYPSNDNIVADARDSDANLSMTGRKFAGQEVDLTLTYDYTEDVQFGLMGGWFLPGASFAKGNDSAATEVIGSMKVTF